MSSWTDVVTTALLGTDRRPLPDDLPAGWSGERGHRSAAGSADEASTAAASRVLALAARHRAVALAGAPLDRVSVPSVSATARPAHAPRAAQDLLASMLAQPEPVLINLWLSACATRGLGVSPDLWTRLARLASRSTAYDRAALRQVIGDRGRWFLQQNPQWAALSSSPPEPAPVAPAAEGGSFPADVAPDEDDSRELAALRAVADVGPATGPAALRLVLTSPDPWSADLGRVALGLVLSGSLGAGTRAAAVEVASRLPLDLAVDHEGAASEAGAYALPEPAYSQRSTVGLGELRARQQRELTLALVQRVLEVRRALRDCFDTRPTPEPEPQSGENTP
jgi:hypothetical protein